MMHDEKLIDSPVDEPLIFGMLISVFESEEKASQNAQKMRDCPRLIISGTISERSITAFIVPKHHEWWLEYPTSHPEVLGAERVDLIVAEHLEYPTSPPIRVTVEGGAEPPCGSNCSSCPMRQEYGCGGCPAISSSPEGE